MAHTELRHLLGVTTSNGLASKSNKKHRSTIRIGSGQVFTQVSSQPVSMPVDRTSLYAPAGAGHDHEIALEKFHYTRRTTLVICMQLIYLSETHSLVRNLRRRSAADLPCCQICSLHLLDAMTAVRLGS
jgi:hypothetical protein